MSYTEQVVSFHCATDTLVGILAIPEQPLATGVVIVVGGPQYRAGSHRQFLLLSRSLAVAGYPVMRFDSRGMGDSSGELRDFEGITEDIEAAIDNLQSHCPQVQSIVLWGLCDAASANLIYLDTVQDDRVRGLVLLNPWVRSESTFARAQVKHYYGQRLLTTAFWAKLFRGQVGVGKAIGELLRTLRSSARAPASAYAGNSFQEKMLRVLKYFPAQVLLILSGNDLVAREFIEYANADPAWSGVLARQNITRCEVSDADHTFSTAQWRTQVEQATIDWLKSAIAD